jgi:hypothetical protein
MGHAERHTNAKSRHAGASMAAVCPQETPAVDTIR